MGLEIERKFLVLDDRWKAAAVPVTLRQGYLVGDAQRVVRVRASGDRAWLTVKGPMQGCGRAEFEYAIPIAEADEMLDTLCLRPLIEKRRSRIPHAGLVWEVDEFLGENAGLVVAEVELTSEDQEFARPLWVGAEVTDDPRFLNANLLKNPYSRWPRDV